LDISKEAYARPYDFLNKWALKIKNIRKVDPDFSQLVVNAFDKPVQKESAITLFQLKPSNQKSGSKLRPHQEDKIIIQGIAKNVWKEYPILDIKQLKEHPEIKKIVGKLYKNKTLHKWLSEVALPRAKKPGRRDSKTKAKQEKICQKLGINC